MLLKSVIFLLLAYYTTAQKVVCYYESWASYDGIDPENLDASLCTHINYAFILIGKDGKLVVSDEDLDINQNLYGRVTELKNKNKNLKVLLSVGGDGDGLSALFSSMAASSSKRAAFIESAEYYINKYNFDGLDIDWETPEAKDKAHYITLLKEVRTAFDKQGWLLTAAVTSSPEDGYDVKQMANSLDWFNIMTYDMYGSWSDYTGQNSPLYASSVEDDWEQVHLNLASCVDLWVKAGAPKAKVVPGIAFYGRSFVLKNANQHGIHAAITSHSGVGGGELNYYDICQEYSSWTRVWDDEQKNPYKYHGTGWFSYDDKESVLEKAKYIKQHGFAGAMIWPVDGDDVFGKCGDKHILLTQVNTGLGRTL